MDIYEPRLLMEAYAEVYQSQDVDTELYEQVVEFLINEGYAEDLDDADALIEELSDEEIEGVLDEVTGGGKIDPKTGNYTVETSPAKKRFIQTRKKLDRESNWNTAAISAGSRSRYVSGDAANSHRHIYPHSTPGVSSNLSMSPVRRAELAASRADRQGDTKRGNKIRAIMGLGEQLDTYDLVLEHLISEGYADTEDAALQIMAHMSEEWVDGIIDEAATIRSVTSSDGEKRYKSPEYSDSERENIRKTAHRKKRLKQLRTASQSDRRISQREYNSDEIRKKIEKNHPANVMNAIVGDPDLHYDDYYYRHVNTNHAARRRRASGR